MRSGSNPMIESSCPSALQRAELFGASRGGLEEGGGERLLAELDGRAQDGVSELGDPPAAREDKAHKAGIRPSRLLGMATAPVSVPDAMGGTDGRGR